MTGALGRALFLMATLVVFTLLSAPLLVNAQTSQKAENCAAKYQQCLKVVVAANKVECVGEWQGCMQKCTGAKFACNKDPECQYHCTEVASSEIGVINCCSPLEGPEKENTCKQKIDDKCVSDRVKPTDPGQTGGGQPPGTPSLPSPTQPPQTGALAPHEAFLKPTVENNPSIWDQVSASNKSILDQLSNYFRGDNLNNLNIDDPFDSGINGSFFSDVGGIQTNVPGTVVDLNQPFDPNAPSAATTFTNNGEPSSSANDSWWMRQWDTAQGLGEYVLDKVTDGTTAVRDFFFGGDAVANPATNPDGIFNVDGVKFENGYGRIDSTEPTITKISIYDEDGNLVKTQDTNPQSLKDIASDIRADPYAYIGGKTPEGESLVRTGYLKLETEDGRFAYFSPSDQFTDSPKTEITVDSSSVIDGNSKDLPQNYQDALARQRDFMARRNEMYDQQSWNEYFFGDSNTAPPTANPPPAVALIEPIETLTEVPPPPADPPPTELPPVVVAGGPPDDPVTPPSGGDSTRAPVPGDGTGDRATGGGPGSPAGKGDQTAQNPGDQTGGGKAGGSSGSNTDTPIPGDGLARQPAPNLWDALLAGLKSFLPISPANASLPQRQGTQNPPPAAQPPRQQQQPLPGQQPAQQPAGISPEDRKLLEELQKNYSDAKKAIQGAIPTSPERVPLEDLQAKKGELEKKLEELGLKPAPTQDPKNDARLDEDVDGRLVYAKPGTDPATGKSYDPVPVVDSVTPEGKPTAPPWANLPAQKIPPGGIVNPTASPPSSGPRVEIVAPDKVRIVIPGAAVPTPVKELAKKAIGALPENGITRKMVDKDAAKKPTPAGKKRLTVYYPGSDCKVGVDPGCKPGIEGKKIGSKDNYIDRNTPVVAAGPSSRLRFGDVVKLTNPDTGKSTFAVVGDVCPACGSGIDATPAVYQKLGPYAEVNKKKMDVEIVSRGGSWDNKLAAVHGLNAAGAPGTPRIAKFPSEKVAEAGREVVEKGKELAKQVVTRKVTATTVPSPSAPPPNPSPPAPSEAKPTSPLPAVELPPSSSSDAPPAPLPPRTNVIADALRMAGDAAANFAQKVGDTLADVPTRVRDALAGLGSTPPTTPAPTPPSERIVVGTFNGEPIYADPPGAPRSYDDGAPVAPTPSPERLASLPPKFTDLERQALNKIPETAEAMRGPGKELEDAKREKNWEKFQDGNADRSDVHAELRRQGEALIKDPNISPEFKNKLRDAMRAMNGLNNAFDSAAARTESEIYSNQVAQMLKKYFNWPAEPDILEKLGRVGNAYPGAVEKFVNLADQAVQDAITREIEKQTLPPEKATTLFGRITEAGELLGEVEAKMTQAAKEGKLAELRSGAHSLGQVLEERLAPAIRELVNRAEISPTTKEEHERQLQRALDYGEAVNKSMDIFAGQTPREKAEELSGFRKEVEDDIAGLKKALGNLKDGPDTQTALRSVDPANVPSGAREALADLQRANGELPAANKKFVDALNTGNSDNIFAANRELQQKMRDYDTAARALIERPEIPADLRAKLLPGLEGMQRDTKEIGNAIGAGDSTSAFKIMTQGVDPNLAEQLYGRGQNIADAQGKVNDAVAAALTKKPTGELKFGEIAPPPAAPGMRSLPRQIADVSDALRAGDDPQAPNPSEAILTSAPPPAPPATAQQPNPDASVAKNPYSPFSIFRQTELPGASSGDRVQDIGAKIAAAISNPTPLGDPNGDPNAPPSKEAPIPQQASLWDWAKSWFSPAPGVPGGVGEGASGTGGSGTGVGDGSGAGTAPPPNSITVNGPAGEWSLKMQEGLTEEQKTAVQEYAEKRVEYFDRLAMTNRPPQAEIDKAGKDFVNAEETLKKNGLTTTVRDGAMYVERLALSSAPTSRYSDLLEPVTPPIGFNTTIPADSLRSPFDYLPKVPDGVTLPGASAGGVAPTGGTGAGIGSGLGVGIGGGEFSGTGVGVGSGADTKTDAGAGSEKSWYQKVVDFWKNPTPGVSVGGGLGGPPTPPPSNAFVPQFAPEKFNEVESWTDRASRWVRENITGTTPPPDATAAPPSATPPATTPPPPGTPPPSTTPPPSELPPKTETPAPKPGDVKPPGTETKPPPQSPPSGGPAPSAAPAKSGSNSTGAFWRGLQMALPLLAQLMQLAGFNQPAQPATPPTVSASVNLTANPATVQSGGRSTLRWTSSGAVNCTLHGPGGQIASGGATGATTTLPLTRSSQFAVRCSAQNGTAVSAMTVVLVDGAPFAPDPVQLIGPGNGTGGTGTSGGVGTGGGAGSGTGGVNFNGEPPGSSVNPPTSGHDASGKNVSPWCDPQQSIDTFIQCLCALDPLGCKPWR